MSRRRKPAAARAPVPVYVADHDREDGGSMRDRDEEYVRLVLWVAALEAGGHRPCSIVLDAATHWLAAHEVTAQA